VHSIFYKKEPAQYQPMSSRGANEKGETTRRKCEAVRKKTEIEKEVEV
jgi:hypothetical protein